MTTIIIEDEPLIAETIKTALEKEGYTIVGMTDNGKEALFDIDQLQPDLILVDITLEGKMDGIEMVEHLKKKSDVPYIFLTSHSDDHTLERVKQTDPAGFIVKPFNEKTLKSNIEIALYKNKVQKQSVSSNEEMNETMIERHNAKVKQQDTVYFLGDVVINKKYLELVQTLENAHTARFMADGLDEKAARAKASKQANEDARFVLPNACETKMVMTMNCRSLQNFFNLRCCNRAQWEIRAVADEMLRLVLPLAPHIFASAGPRCLVGPCPEGRMCCGKQTEVRAKYAKLKEEAV